MVKCVIFASLNRIAEISQLDRDAKVLWVVARELKCSVWLLGWLLTCPSENIPTSKSLWLSKIHHERHLSKGCELDF